MTSHMAPTLQARHFIQVQTYLSTQEPYLGSQQTKGLLPNLLSLFQGGSLKTKDASLILPVLTGPPWDWRPLESRHSLPSGATCTASAHNLKATNRIWLTSFEFATLIYPTVIDFYKQCISTYLKTMELILNQMIQL